MRWLIVGAGALGSVLAGHLVRAGEDVTLLTRGARAKLLRERGLTLTGLSSFTLPVRIIEDPTAVKSADVLVLTVKTYDTEAALAPLKHVQVESCFSVQNGVVKDEQLAAVFGESAVLGCAADFSGEVLADGVVRYTRNEGLYLGELNGGISDRVRAIAALLEAAAIHTITSQNIQSVEWSKLVGWLAITAPAVLTRLVTHRLVQDPDVARLQVLLAKEAVQVSDKLGIPLEDLFMASPSRTLVRSTPEEWMERSRQYGLNMEAQGLTAHKMSALQDLERGRRLEIEETFGYIVQKAAELGLSVPRLETCYRLLLALDRTGR